jgi:hypothetical protein
LELMSPSQLLAHEKFTSEESRIKPRRNKSSTGNLDLPVLGGVEHGGSRLAHPLPRLGALISGLSSPRVEAVCLRFGESSANRASEPVIFCVLRARCLAHLDCNAPDRRGFHDFRRIITRPESMGSQRVKPRRISVAARLASRPPTLVDECGPSRRLG